MFVCKQTAIKLFNRGCTMSVYFKGDLDTRWYAVEHITFETIMSFYDKQEQREMSFDFEGTDGRCNGEIFQCQP